MVQAFSRDFKLLCLQAAIIAFNASAIAALIPSIAASFHQAPLFMGRLTWLYMIPYGACALLWAPLSHSFKTKQLVGLSFLLCSLSCLGIAFSRNVPQIFFFTLVMGFFGSSQTPLSLIVIGHETSSDKGRYVGTYFAGTFISALCGLIVSGIIMWRYVFIIPAIAGIIVSLISARAMSGFDYRREAVKLTYLRTLLNPIVGKLFFLIFVSSLLYHSIQQWMGVYLKSNYLLGQTAISLFFTFSLGWAFLSEYYGGFLSDSQGRVKVFSWGLVLMFIFVAGLIALKTQPVWPLFLLVLFWGGGWGFVHVGLASYLTHLPGEYLRDASSLNSSLRFLSGGIGAFLSGKMIGLVGFQYCFAIIGVILFIMAVVAKRVLKERGQ